MIVQFYYFDDCPSHEQALKRVQYVLMEEGVDAEIVVYEIDSDADARKYDFYGSPTIRIDGEDIAPHSPAAVVGLSCRAYQTMDGRISPLPPLELIRSALRRALDRSNARDESK